MSPADRRRRRVRPATVVGIALLLLVLAVLIGGLSRVGSVSTSYWRSVDRSYAAQGAVIVEQSNGTAADLRRLLEGWTRQTRRGLESTLDLLVRTTGRQAQAAAALAPPAPWGGLGTGFVAVLADRARAATDLRSAVDGLLGMVPLPVRTVAGVDPAPGTAGGSAALSPTQAATALGRVGALLLAADQRYAQVRRGFDRAPGGARLPASRWVRDAASWSSGPALTAADQLAGAPQLAPRHDVVLVPTAIDVTPAPVPTPGAAAGVTILPPTSALQVTAVVANDGNVDERRLAVSASVQPVGGGSGSGTQRTASVSLAAGASQAVSLGALHVRAGLTYQLTVAVTPPAGEVPGSPTSRSFTLTVAPNAAPPPTTTTTTTPPRTRPHGSTTTTAPAGAHPATPTTGRSTTTTGAGRSSGG